MKISVPPEISLEMLCVVSVSGGKDSTATALALREAGVPYQMVFADTGWEAPETYAHLDHLREKLGPIAVVRAKRQMRERMLYGASAPTRLGRWCTIELKLEPLKEYHAELEKNTGEQTVSVVGIRAEESEKRAKMKVFEDSDQWGGYVWRPILDWTIEDVLSIHHRHGVDVNPLYKRGHNRVGCFPCIHSNRDEIALVAKHAPERIDEIRELEAEMTRLRAERNAEKPGRYKRETATFFQGREGKPDPTIDRVVDLAKMGARKKKRVVQLTMLVDNEPTGGCYSWGMCEPPPKK